MKISELITQVLLELNDETNATFSEGELFQYIKDCLSFINLRAKNYKVPEEILNKGLSLEEELNEDYLDLEFVKEYVKRKALSRIGDKFVKFTTPNLSNQLFKLGVYNESH